MRSDRKCAECGIREDDSRTAGRGKCLKFTSGGPVFEEHSWAKAKSQQAHGAVDPSQYGFNTSPRAFDEGIRSQFIREDMPAPSTPAMYGRGSSPAAPSPTVPSRQYVRMSHQDIIRECAPIIRQMRREPRSYVGGHPMKPADLVRVGIRVSVGTRF